jgi:hypothetical protein
MGIKLDRNKKKNWFLRVMYKVTKLTPLSNRSKFKLFLNLEWFFDRIAHEYSFKIYEPKKTPC